MDRIEEKKKLTEDYNGRKKNEGHGQAARSARRDGDEKRNLLETIPAEWGMAATFLTGSGLGLTTTHHLEATLAVKLDTTGISLRRGSPRSIRALLILSMHLEAKVPPRHKYNDGSAGDRETAVSPYAPVITYTTNELSIFNYLPFAACGISV
ncbi:hypothetical protein M752DRAFT_269369 [Aspergillus phoenicis ATCC 13157]|uniref:Uncharacterized protein n=1 Tax=Aspergillus phoenicis ATCC 13157 TaxID=1353007 RepID=A0A370P9B8_ASPPH|nr:hypothetical protein M752DRAFT_269369 [Aspergillus phoenicis ATCC 13157]